MKKLFTMMLAILVSFGLVLPTAAQESTNVAKIGEKEYATLNDAISEVKTGETIVLLKNVDNATGISVKSGSNFTVDFAGHTYTLIGPGQGSSGTETNGFQLLKDSNITFKNGTINVGKNPDRIKMIIQNYANLTLEDMTIDPENKLSAGTTNTEDFALSINNGNITFKGNTTIKASSPDVISFDICKFNNYPGVTVSFAEDYTGTIEGTILYDSSDNTTHTLDIKGNGTFANISYSDNNAEVAKKAIAIHSGTYQSVSALDYLKENSKVTIKLTDDVTKSIVIPENTEVLLDLNGQNITNSENQHTITNTGKLTITGKGMVDNTSHIKGALVSKGQGASVIIDGGEFTRSKEAGSSPTVSGGNSWYVISNEKGSEMTINNANVHSNGKYSSLVRNYGKMTINGGRFANGFITVKNEEASSLDITGGVINSDTQAIQTYGNTKVSQATVEGQITISRFENYASNFELTGGQVSGDVVILDDAEATNNVNVVIDGGFVDGELKILDANRKPIEETKVLNIDVKSGAFSNNVLKYAVNSQALINIDGTYYVDNVDQLSRLALDAQNKVVIIKGVDSIYIPEGVVVENTSGQSVEVNGIVLEDGKTLVPEGMKLNKAPTITCEDVVLSVGDVFEPLKGVTASDVEDGDLTKAIKTIKNTVDTSKAGIYEVTYQVKDSEGATATKTIKVTVKDVAQDGFNEVVQTSDSQSSNVLYISLAAISMFAIVGLVAYKKKRVN